MRGVLLSLALAFVLMGAAPATSSAAAMSTAPAISAASSPVFALQQVPDKTVNVDINVGHSARAWYKSPVWIAIGALAVIVVLMLIVMAARGSGGTTIVKD